MAKKRSSGLGKRVSFMDREIVNENKEIMRYNAMLERKLTSRAQLAHLSEDLYGAVVSERAYEDLRAPVNLLIESLLDGERFDRASKAAWDNLVESTPTVELDAVKSRWNRLRFLVQSEWAKTHPKDAPKTSERPSRPTSPVRAKVTPKTEPVVRVSTPAISEEERQIRSLQRTLFAAGKTVEGYDTLHKALMRLTNLLASGENTWEVALKRTWKVMDKGDDPKVTGRLWFQIVTAVGEKWFELHPEQAPAPKPQRHVKTPEEKAAEYKSRLRQRLVTAGSTARSWAILQFEADHLLDALVDKCPIAKAVSDSTAMLDARKDKVSAAEWELIVHEWQEIVDKVSIEWKTVLQERRERYLRRQASVSTVPLASEVADLSDPKPQEAVA